MASHAASLSITVPTTTASSVGSNASPRPKEIAPFLRSLRKMLEEESASILCWTSDGKAFEIHDFEAMSNYVLPKYFKHRKYASFQRQLNYFNFRKWTKSKAVVCTFSNPFFQRDQPELAWHILRKKCPSGSNKASATAKKHGNLSAPAIRTDMSQFALSSSQRPSHHNLPKVPAPLPTSAPASMPMTWHEVDDQFRIMVPSVADEDLFGLDVFGDELAKSFDSPMAVSDLPEKDLNLLEWVDKAFPTLEMVTVLDQTPQHFQSESLFGGPSLIL